MAESRLPYTVTSAVEMGRAVPAFGQALELHNRGMLNEAAATFLALSDQPALAVFCQHQLAIIAAQRNDIPQAIERLKRAMALAPNQPMLLQTLVTVLEGAGKLPEALDVMLELGCVYHMLPDRPRAVDIYQRMLAVDARRYGAWANLGVELCLAGEVEAGARHLYQAVVLAGRVIPLLASFAEQLRESVAAGGLDLENGVTLPPGTPTGMSDKPADVLISLGKTMSELRYRREAIRCYRMAVEIRPAFVLAHWNLSMALLSAGEYREGWSEYEWRWLREPTSDPRRLLSIPRWKGEPPEGRRLLVYAEQGFGDVIQFAPLVRQLAQQAGHVVFQVFLPLVRLLAHNLDSERIEVAGLPPNQDEIGSDRPFDGFVAQMSLPHFMGLDTADLPLFTTPLQAIPEDVERWRERLGPCKGRRIGIAWAGRPEHGNDHQRSLPKDALASLLALPGIEWVSLQLGPRRDEFAELAPDALDLSDELKDFADTAAVITQLDGVVAVDTAIVHLAGSMGVPVWLMLPFASDWRWSDADDQAAWYPNVRLFRQERRGDWAGVVSRIAAAVSGNPVEETP